MREIRMTVYAGLLKKNSNLGGAQGEGNVTDLLIEFRPEWDGTTKTITFYDANMENPVQVILTTALLEDAAQDIRTYRVPIPSEPLSIAGQMTFTIDGYVSGSRARTAQDTLIVLPSPMVKDPSAITPTQAEQLQAGIDAVLEDIAGMETAIANEAGREATEEGRRTAEQARVAAEQGRATAEQGRASAEESRMIQETARQDAEAERAAAEQARVDTNSGIVAQATHQATAAGQSANAAAGSAQTAAQQADAAAGSAAQALASQQAATNSVNLAGGAANAAQNAAEEAVASAAAASSAAARATAVAGQIPTVNAAGNWAVGGGDTGVPATGPQGPAGVGVPSGGTAGQVLSKTEDGTAWTDPPSGGVQPDWNQNDPTAADYVKNRTHYAVPLGPRTWDGDVTGKQSAMGMYYKVSNSTYNPQNIVAAHIAFNNNGTITEVSGKDAAMSVNFDGYILFSDYVVVCLDATKVLMGNSFPSVGTYFLSRSDLGYVSSFCVYVIDDDSRLHRKYLPPDAILPSVTASDNGKVLQVVGGDWAAVTIENAAGGSY